ncbi:uncharacterized protein LOC134222715 [Armigeres subalbatus]|uniref:uncharacterized protein LOC134222715 n=1 Tax=Armigeres subalbatus TaxID=124917 RepID=UPI002ED4E1C3
MEQTINEEGDGGNEEDVFQTDPVVEEYVDKSFERFEHVEYLTWEDNNDIAEYPMDETEAANLEQDFLDDNACNDEALLHDENHQQAANDPETDDDNHDTDKIGRWDWVTRLTALEGGSGQVLHAWRIYAH